jgi:ribosomal-protein-alanine N-acetyltransferase
MTKEQFNHLFETFPIIKFKDITMRALHDGDAESFFLYASNEKVKKYLSNDDIPTSVEKAKQELGYWSRLFNYKAGFYWGVEDNETKKLIGTCGFNNWSTTHGRAEISYDLDVEYWGKSIMTRCVAEICRFAVQKMKVHRIQATVAHDNVASMRLLDKNGFKREGVLRNYGVLHGFSKDFYMYSLIRGEYKPMPSKG